MIVINKKGFTLVEIIVIIAIIGILVLLANGKFQNNVEKAKLTHIKHDTRVGEDIIGIYLSEKYAFDDDISEMEVEKVNERVKDERVYSPLGLHTDEFDSDVKFVIVNELVKSMRSKLPGQFISDMGGKVYYIDETTPNDAGNEDVPEKPENEDVSEEPEEPEVEKIQLKDLPVGSVVYDEDWEFFNENVMWMIAHQHGSTTTLITDSTLGTSKYSNTTSDLSADSGPIITYLNNFKTHMSSKFRSKMNTIRVNYTLPGQWNYNYNTDIFIPSVEELGGGISAASNGYGYREGSKFNAFNSNSSRANRWVYWTRSTYNKQVGGSYVNAIVTVESSGAFNYKPANSSLVHVRPAIRFDSDTWLIEDDSGKYKFVW